MCEGCGDCGIQSNCLSVQPVDTEFGRKTRIHQSSCNKDYSCLAGDCPSFLTVVPAKRSRITKLTSRSEGGARRHPAVDHVALVAPTSRLSGTDATIRMPGIGGTGVVTVSQILGTAATLDGKFVSGLDQTGLSQKAGPVVSDLRITAAPVDGSNKTSTGAVDLYLVFDQLVALMANNVSGCAPARTIAVVSTAKSPTGAMLRDPRATYPSDADLRADLDAVTRAADNRYLDAGAVALGLFGDSTTANVLQLGIAYQLGALPISAEAIEQAIELNGAAVEANKAAFRLGSDVDHRSRSRRAPRPNNRPTSCPHRPPRWRPTSCGVDWARASWDASCACGQRTWWPTRTSATPSSSSTRWKRSPPAAWTPTPKPWPATSTS